MKEERENKSEENNMKSCIHSISHAKVFISHFQLDAVYVFFFTVAVARIVLVYRSNFKMPWTLAPKQRNIYY